MEYEIVRKKSKFFQTEGTTTISYLVISVLFGTLEYLFERGANDGFNTLGDGLWWCIVTITTATEIFTDYNRRKDCCRCNYVRWTQFLCPTHWNYIHCFDQSSPAIQGKENGISLLENHIIICGWNDDV